MSAIRKSIAVLYVDDTHGEWQYSVNGGQTWLAFGDVDETSATVLAEDDLVRFVPDENWNGTVEKGIGFRAWDQYDQLAAGTTGVDTTLRTGYTDGPPSDTTPYSIDIEYASIEVNPVPDPPET